jgi:hypothetical protein
MDGYYKSTTTVVTCLSCGEGAISCNLALATGCSVGYYLNALSACVKCSNVNALGCELKG